MAARRENGVWVNDSNEAATIIVNADGSAVSAGGGGGTSSADDATFTPGASSVTPAGGIVTSDSVDSGDVGAFAMLPNRQQKISLYDSSGNEITSFGGGTQYTEDAAAAANPVGGALILVRADAPSGVTTTDGDNVAARGTDKGEQYVKHVDAVTIQDGGNTITVDGTVAVTNAGLTELAAAINGSSQMDVNIAASGATVPVSNGGLTELAAAINSSKVDVNIVTSDVAMGGGTQYTEADTDASITGTAVMWEDTADTLRAVSAAKPLPVAIISGAGSGGTAAADDADFTDGTTSGTPAMGVYESTPTSVTDGDLGIVGITETRSLKTSDAAAAALLTTIDADTSAMAVSLAALDNAVAGNELQVDVLTMPTVAVTQSGTWDEVGINDSGNSITVDNGGTFAVQVDGSALTALQLIDDTVATLGTTTYTETTTKGLTIGAVRRDADTTLVDTTNEIGPLQMDANGRLKVEAFSGETLPVSLASVPSHAVTNAGVFATQVDGAALTALQLIDNPVLVDDAAFTPAVSSVMMAGFQADESSTDSVDEGDAGAARMTLTRKVIVTPQPHTAGGLSIFRSLDIDESEEEVKGTAGVLYSIAAFNRTSTPLYLKFYNLTAASTTVGSSTPVLTFLVPANADSDGAGFVLEKTYGWTFDTAISVACTTGIADADTGAPGANDCLINLGYL